VRLVKLAVAYFSQCEKHSRTGKQEKECLDQLSNNRIFKEGIN
jgi:hypothetical protein